MADTIAANAPVNVPAQASRKKVKLSSDKKLKAQPAYSNDNKQQL